MAIQKSLGNLLKIYPYTKEAHGYLAGYAKTTLQDTSEVKFIFSKLVTILLSFLNKSRKPLYLQT